MTQVKSSQVKNKTTRTAPARAHTSDRYRAIPRIAREGNGFIATRDYNLHGPTHPWHSVASSTENLPRPLWGRTKRGRCGAENCLQGAHLRQGQIQQVHEPFRYSKEPAVNLPRDFISPCGRRLLYFCRAFWHCDGVSVYMISGGQPNLGTSQNSGVMACLVLPLRTPPK